MTVTSNTTSNTTSTSSHDDLRMQSLERLRRARENRDACIQRARHFGIALTTSDTGRLWTFRLSDDDGSDPTRTPRAEWWPEKALLAFDGKYKRAVIAETTFDVFREVRERWTGTAESLSGAGARS